MHSPYNNGHSPAIAKLAASASSIGLVFASTGFGCVYAWRTGSTHGYMLGALTVMFAAALEIAKPLAVNGFFSAIRHRVFGQALCLLLLSALALAYSLTAELSLMAGIRSDVVAARQAQSRAARDHAKAVEHREVERQRIERELATVGKARPAAELKAIIAAYRSKGACAIPDMASVCPANKLAPELGRAERREKLELALAALSQGEHSAASVPMVEVKADPAAEALATYLGLLGITMRSATLTELLILIPVLALEVGSALAVVLAGSVAAGDGRARSGKTERANSQGERSLAERPAEHPNASPEPAPAKLSRANSLDRSPALDERTPRPSHERVLAALRAKDGVLFGSQGALGASFGWSKTRLHEVLHELVAAGRVRLSVGRHGTTVQMVGGSA